jgi:tetratricopeptide (TPR) repeat protein
MCRQAEIEMAGAVAKQEKAEEFRRQISGEGAQSSKTTSPSSPPRAPILPMELQTPQADGGSPTLSPANRAAEDVNYFNQAEVAIQRAVEKERPSGDKFFHCNKAIRAFDAALTKQSLDDESRERARHMLSYAHHGAGVYHFKGRNYIEAQSHLDSALGKEGEREGLGHGLSNSTLAVTQKLRVYCVYALGKKAYREHRHDEAKRLLRLVLEPEYRCWLELWDDKDTSKDYVKTTKQHIDDIEAALRMREQNIEGDTKLVAWAETNRLVLRNVSCGASYLMRSCKSLPSELEEEIDVDYLREVEDKDVKEVIADLIDLHESMNTMKAKMLLKKAKNLSQLDELRDTLEEFGITTLRQLVSKGTHVHEDVQRIFQGVCRKGKLFTEIFADVKVALSPENCGDTHTDTVNSGLTWSFSTQTTGRHCFTRKLLFGNARSPTGNAVLQANTTKSIRTTYQDRQSRMHLRVPRNISTAHCLAAKVSRYDKRASKKAASCCTSRCFHHYIMTPTKLRPSTSQR